MKNRKRPKPLSSFSAPTCFSTLLLRLRHRSDDGWRFSPTSGGTISHPLTSAIRTQQPHDLTLLLLPLRRFLRDAHGTPNAVLRVERRTSTVSVFFFGVCFLSFLRLTNARFCRKSAVCSIKALEKRSKETRKRVSDLPKFTFLPGLSFLFLISPNFLNKFSTQFNSYSRLILHPFDFAQPSSLNLPLFLSVIFNYLIMG